MAAHWSKPLTRRLKLKGDDELVTLRDADVFFTDHFATVRHVAVQHAMGLLMKAAETGRLADRRRATEQVAVALRVQRWL